MNDYRKDFSLLKGNIWLNAASEGPLPSDAAASLKEAVEWKSKPWLLDLPKFVEIPKRLKESIGRLIGVDSRDVILGNSATYGLQLLADGIPWQKGDEILCMQNDFPADILPWLGLEDKGVNVRQIAARGKVLQPDELLENITDRTRLFCVAHVHTFTGIILDAARFAEICKERGVVFVLNISQSAGTMPIDISAIGADAVVCAGYKWLCGPYGTGFCWMRPEIRHRLKLNRAYWAAALSAEDLKNEGALTFKDIKTARKFDVYGTANFFNFVPFKSAVDYWLEAGLDNVKTYHQCLIDRLFLELDVGRYELISPREGPWRSSLVVLSHKKRERNEQIFQGLRNQGIHTALWKDNIRIAAHVYNTEDEIGKALAALHRF